MIPATISNKNRNSAEEFIFQTIKTDINSSWVIFHSLDLVGQKGTVWKEIDFLLVGPPGIFIIEVKGGTIFREDGNWYSQGKTGTHHLKQGPFKQVLDNTFAIRTALEKHLDVETLNKMLIGYGVAFPDSYSKSIKGTDVIPEIIYDFKSRQDTFDKYIDSLTQYWEGTFSANTALGKVQIDRNLIKQIIEIFRPDFDLKLSLSLKANQTNEELLALTNQQYSLLDKYNKNNPRILVEGRAGTGKTLCALNIAIEQARNQKKVLLLCYNKRLRTFLSSYVSQHSDFITVDTFHDFIEKLILDNGQQLPKIKNRDTNNYYKHSLPEKCEDILITNDIMDIYDVIIIDEGQDLLRVKYLEIIELLLKGGFKDGSWLVFYDLIQDIYESTEEEALTILNKGRPFNHVLTENCRNTKQIATSTMAISGHIPAPSVKVDGLETEVIWYRDKNHQIREVTKAFNRWVSEGIKTDEMVLLSSKTMKNSSFANGLDNKSLPYDLVEWDKNEQIPKNVIPYSTIHSFKGLEANMVLIGDIDELESSFKPRNTNLLDVAGSRARVGLILSISEKLKPLLEPKLAQKNQIYERESLSEIKDPREIHFDEPLVETDNISGKWSKILNYLTGFFVRR